MLGIPGQVPIPYQLECTVVLLQSLHALFQLLTFGNTMQHCPQASSFAVALGTAARQDNGHIVSMAASLRWPSELDLKSAFVPAVPRQPFFRILLGDPRQSPGGVADNLREHRTLLADLPWQQQVSLERARPDP